MKKLVSECSALLLATLGLVSTATAAKWETNFEKAKAHAGASHRYLLLNFTGSDWCGWCVKLDNEVFDKMEFKKYADENLVRVTLDFPRKTMQKKDLKEQNETLAKQYGIRGFPTIIILSPAGEFVAQTGYMPGGPEKYVEHLEGLIHAHRQKNKIPSPSSWPPAKPTRGVPASVLRAREE